MFANAVSTKYAELLNDLVHGELYARKSFAYLNYEIFIITANACFVPLCSNNMGTQAQKK